MISTNKILRKGWHHLKALRQSLSTFRNGQLDLAGRIFDLNQKVSVDLDGFSLYVMPNDHIGAGIIANKTYEPHVTAQIRRLLKKGDVFLDLGANVGYFSLLATTLVGKSGKVLAFEPNPQNLQLIYSSLLKNECANATVYPYAVSDQAGILRFTIVGSNGGVVSDHSVGQNHHLLVPSVVLDAALKHEDKISLVKIDVEAHEPRALRGMEALIKKHKPKIITEFHPWAIKVNTPEPPEAYLKQIYSYGYEVSIIQPNGKLRKVSNVEEIMGYYESLAQETAWLDLLAT